MTEKPDATYGGREAQPLDRMLQMAAGQGWDFFGDKLAADPRKRASTEGAEADLEQLKNDARLVFETEQGQRLLEWLADITVRRPMWFLGMPEPMNYVAMREGQNALFCTLLKLIAEARGEKPPYREGQS